MTADALLLELEATKRTLREREEELRVERELRRAKEADLERAGAEVKRLLQENTLLRARVDQLAKHMFGKSSEKIRPDQLLLAFQIAEAEAKAADEKETAAGEETGETPKRPRRVKPSQKAGQKPLPVREQIVDPPEAERRCPCCQGEMTRIGEETSEHVEFVPSSLFIHRTRRGKYACRKCQDGVVIAPTPPTAIEKSAAGPGLVAHVVASKIADHIPLYRQEEIFERYGVYIPRSTLKDWMAQAAERLSPIAKAIQADVLKSRVVNSDDTPVTYLLPGGGSATGYVWTYVGERGEVAYDFTGGRSQEGPVAFVGEFSGFFQADAYSGYDVLFKDGRVVEVGCWAHARRYFVEARETDAVEAEAVIALIQRLYAVEAAAKDLSEEERKRLRLERSRPILDAIRARIDAAAPMALPKGPLGKAIGYAQRNWTALTRYLDEGFLEIDNNRAERALRPVAVGRKNWMFAGSLDAGRRAAVLMTVVGTCKLQGIDPFEYLRDVLVRVAAGPPDRIHDLTPRRWKAAVEAGQITPQ